MDLPTRAGNSVSHTFGLGQNHGSFPQLLIFRLNAQMLYLSHCNPVNHLFSSFLKKQESLFLSVFIPTAPTPCCILFPKGSIPKHFRNISYSFPKHSIHSVELPIQKKLKFTYVIAFSVQNRNRECYVSPRTQIYCLYLVKSSIY